MKFKGVSLTDEESLQLQEQSEVDTELDLDYLFQTDLQLDDFFDSDVD